MIFREGLFEGRRILVTGGGTGLGRAMAENFLALGATVVICGRREEVLAETAHEMGAATGGRVETHALDIRDPERVEAAIASIFADGPLDGLVNNAAANFISRTEDLSPRGFEAVVRIVAHGTFHVTQAVGKRWIAGGQGGRRDVVSILSTRLRTGAPFSVPAAMGKAAVQAMTRSLASEWGRHGIRLNAVSPGEIPTEGMSARLRPGQKPGERTAAINPMGRTGTKAELATLVGFLMSGGCDWINGETLVMDGGQAMATGVASYELREWGDAEWQAARGAIRARDAGDKATDKSGDKTGG